MGKKIVWCNCGGEIINTDLLRSVEPMLRQLKVETVKLSDLCGLAALKNKALKDIFKQGNEYLIIGCHPRSMKLLLEQQNSSFSELSYRFLNCISLTKEHVQQELSDFCKDDEQVSTFTEIDSATQWPSWYPIIDYSRCTACGQCADFCLFGVYTKAEGQVSVINPQACKNNCPACARICPHTAIVFPKYKHGGAIAGSETIDEFAEQKRQAQDIDEILGSDLYVALEKRKIKRQSIIRDEAMKIANDERTKALNENKVD